MAISIDTSGMTAGELSDLAGALGCRTLKQLQTKIAEVQALGTEGDLPIDIIVPFIWVARRAVDPSFTLEQARNLPVSEMEAMFPNDQGGQAAPSSGSSSARSATSTGGRRRNSGR